MGVIAVPGREVWRRQPQRVARPCLDKDWKARLWRGSVLAAYPFNYWQNAAIGPQRVDLNSQIEGTVSSAVAEWGIAQGTAGGGRAGRKYVGSPTLSNLTIAALVRFSSVSSLQVITGNDDDNAQGVRIQCNGGSFQLTHLAQANVDLSASAFSANNAYFVAVSHDGTNDYWVVKNLTTGAISSGSVSDTFTPFSPTSGWCPVGYGRLTTESVDGQVGGVFISSAVLSVSELLSWAQNPHSIFFRRPARVFLPAAAGGGATGLASETDTALARAAVAIRAAGLSSETDTALALAARQVRAVGLATEADTALALAARQVRATGLATEADTALALAPNVPGAVGLATETDTALALVPRQIRATGMASESSTAIARPLVQVGSVQMALEIEVAFALPAVQRASVGMAVESDSALALNPGSTGGVAGAADVWNYVLSNGLTAEQTAVQTHAMLTALLASCPADLALVLKLLRNKQVTNPSTGRMTVYDDDGSTVLLEGNLFEDAAGAQPYRGQGAERRERLT